MEREAGASGPCRNPGDARRQARLEPVQKVLTLGPSGHIQFACFIRGHRPIQPVGVSHSSCNLRRMTSSRSLETQALAQQLSEDLRTRWVPDVIRDVDLGKHRFEQERALDREDASTLQVPKGDGGLRTVWQLSTNAIEHLHQSTSDFRDISEASLHSHVCGYRSGADGETYQNEYQRFKQISQGLSESSRITVSTDVSKFFASVQPDLISDLMLSRFGSSWCQSSSFLTELENIGVSHLPAGYADARLIANMILSFVDEAIPYGFTRWVDDYRVFVDSEEQANNALTIMSERLSILGLRLSTEKTLIQSVDTFSNSRLGKSLDSVYHPDDDSPEATNMALRTVFINGMGTEDRRLIRFALPRMKTTGDSFAIEHSLGMLARGSIDTPRIVDYLSAFTGIEIVQKGVEDLLSESTPWILGRLAPLFSDFAPSPAAWDKIRSIMQDPQIPGVVRELYLRVTALHGRLDDVETFIDEPWCTVRTRVAVLTDLSLDSRAFIQSGSSGYYELFKELGPLPAPSASSIL